jgi:hypothetical protein
MKSSLILLLFLAPAIVTAQAIDDVPSTDDSVAADIDFVGVGGDRVELGVGPGYIQSRDELGSPLTYSATGAALSFRYEYIGETYRHDIRLGYDGPGISPSPLTSSATNDQGSTHTTSYTLASASYLYLWKIASLGDMAIEVGPKAEWLYFERQYDYNSFLAEGSWERIITADLQLRLEYPIDERQEVSVGSSAAVLGTVQRPPYSLHGIENSEGVSRFVTAESFPKIAAAIYYNYHIADDFYLSIHADFMYYRFDEPLPTATVLQGVGFVIGLKL